MRVFNWRLRRARLKAVHLNRRERGVFSATTFSELSRYRTNLQHTSRPSRRALLRYTTRRVTRPPATSSSSKLFSVSLASLDHSNERARPIIQLS